MDHHRAPELLSLNKQRADAEEWDKERKCNTIKR